MQTMPAYTLGNAFYKAVEGDHVEVWLSPLNSAPWAFKSIDWFYYVPSLNDWVKHDNPPEMNGQAPLRLLNVTTDLSGFWLCKIVNSNNLKVDIPFHLEVIKKPTYSYSDLPSTEEKTDFPVFTPIGTLKSIKLEAAGLLLTDPVYHRGNLSTKGFNYTVKLIPEWDEVPGTDYSKYRPRVNSIEVFESSLTPANNWIDNVEIDYGTLEVKLSSNGKTTQQINSTRITVIVKTINGGEARALINLYFED